MGLARDWYASLLFVSLSLHVITASATRARATYGEACDSTDLRCDSRKSLTCDNGSCRCMKPAEMIYDGAMGKCVVLSGERCTYTAIEILSDSSQQEKRWTERLDCVENGQCNEQGYCECSRNFFETSKGECAPSRSHGETCTEHQECLESKHLICVEGTCSCNETESVYALGGCLAKAGVPYNKYDGCMKSTFPSVHGFCECSRDSFQTSDRGCAPRRSHGETCTKDDECLVSRHLHCVEGTCSCNETEAIFDPEYKKCVAKVGVSPHKYDGRCVRNAYYGHTCQCPPGYTTSKDGFCIATLGHSCYPHISPCDFNWECSNLYCTCPYPEFQKSVEGKCVSSLGGPCTLVSSLTGDLVTFRCEDPNAECRKNEYNIEECQCKPGWIESRGRQCRRDIGFPCIRNEDCDDMADLICLNGKCACRKLREFDSKTKKCRGLVGAMCDTTEEAFCIDGASCVSFRSSVSSGTCQCVPPATPDPTTRTCSGIKVIKRTAGDELGFNDTTTSLEHISSN